MSLAATTFCSRYSSLVLQRIMENGMAAEEINVMGTMADVIGLSIKCKM